MNTKLCYVLGPLLLAAVLLVACEEEQQAEIIEKVIPVKAFVAETTNLDLSSTFTGSLEGEKQAVVYAKLSEAVQDIPVTEGQTVKAGQVLVALDKYGPSSQYNSSLSLFKNSEKTYEKMAYLYKEGAISESQYDAAATEYEVNKAGFEAVSRLVNVQSPIAGIVTAIDVSEGEFVAQGQRLATVATTGKLRIRFGVNDNEIAAFETGSEVLVSSEATDHVATGEVISVAGSANTSTRAFEVEALVDNDGDHFSPGMFVRVDFVRERLENVVVVPSRSILTLEGNPTLFTVNGGQSHRKTVSLGAELDGMVIVVSGIAVGDTVVTLGQDFLEDEMSVNVTSLNGHKR